MCKGAETVSRWEAIGAPQNVIDWIREGIRVPLGSFPQPFHLTNNSFSSKQWNFVQGELIRLECAGFVEQCEVKPRYISPLGCVPKRNGKHRLITNFRFLNGHCVKSSFKNEDIRVVADIVKYGDHMSTVDIKDGFYHVPVHIDDRELLGFAFENKYYHWCVLPFGLSCSPYYFCKFVRPIVSYLRTLGVRISVYVDDFIVCAEPKYITDHTDLLLNTLEELGIQANFTKSKLCAGQVVDYLGYTILTFSDSGFPVIKAHKDRIYKVKRQIRQVLNKGWCSARCLARVAGQCVSVAWVVSPGKLFLRHIYRLLATRSSWEDSLCLDKCVVEELQWWLTAVDEWNCKVLDNRCIDGQLVTDASHIGWGAVYENRQAAGEWNIRLSRMSSNRRELMAILMGFKAFSPFFGGKHIQILSDNTSALAYIRNKGGPNVFLTGIAKAIWAEAEDLGVYLSCKHIAGQSNVTADRLSRTWDKSNWMLHPRLFSFLDRTWGPHTIDRFASCTNAQVELFNSRFWEPLTAGVDALAQTDWDVHNNWVNPPFCLLPKVLSKVVEQKAHATVIAPVFRGQPWFQTLQSLSVLPPIRIPNSVQTFLRMGPVPEPRRNLGWKVYAWKIYGGVSSGRRAGLTER